MNPAQYYPPCTRQELVVAPMLGWNHAGTLLSYALNARNILEYGSGGSTLWLAMMCPEATILSVEHDQKWFDRVSKLGHILHDAELFGTNLTVILGSPASYVRGGSVTTRGPFDLIFVDGAHEQRTPCLKAAHGLLAPGGVVILDNSEVAAYQEGMAFLLSQPGMVLIEDTEDTTWNPERSHRKMWVVQKNEVGPV